MSGFFERLTFFTMPLNFLVVLEARLRKPSLSERFLASESSTTSASSSEVVDERERSSKLAGSPASPSNKCTSMLGNGMPILALSSAFLMSRNKSHFVYKKENQRRVTHHTQYIHTHTHTHKAYSNVRQSNLVF